MADLLQRERADVGTYDDIAAAAVRTTGMSDFGGTELEEGLRLLVEDLSAPQAGLTPRGNYFQRAEVKATLVGRLLLEAQLAAHPAAADVVIEGPVFVMGLPRTGTTALHRLLAADPSTQALELWLTQYPQPRPPRSTWSTDPIFTAMQEAFSAHHVANPEFMGIHYLDAASVEECWRILRQSGLSNSFETLADVPSYAAWLDRQDWTPAYERHRRALQLIGSNDPGKRWVLKNPSHMGALDAIFAVYPDARIVYTHRPPATCLASACSLAAEATAGHSTTFVGSRIGETQLDLWTRQFHAFHDARSRYPADRFADVAFEDLRRDPVGTVRGIHEQFGLAYSPEVEAAVVALDHESRTGAAAPSHSYSLADYGLSEAQVAAGFDR